MALLTVDETAKMLKISPITVRRYIALGRLPAVKVGKGVRVREESIEQLMQPIEAKAAKQTKERPVRRGKRPSATDALWRIVELGRTAGPSEGPTYVSENKHKHLAEGFLAHIE